MPASMTETIKRTGLNTRSVCIFKASASQVNSPVLSYAFSRQLTTALATGQPGNDCPEPHGGQRAHGWGQRHFRPEFANHIPGLSRRSPTQILCWRLSEGTRGGELDGPDGHSLPQAKPTINHSLLESAALSHRAGIVAQDENLPRPEAPIDKPRRHQTASHGSCT
jgi:hypothetical protein